MSDPKPVKAIVERYTLFGREYLRLACGHSVPAIVHGRRIGAKGKAWCMECTFDEAKDRDRAASTRTRRK